MRVNIFMANILLLDSNETARRAMQGILARGNHRFAAADTAKEAWDFVNRNVKVDLVFVELGLKEGNGFPFIERLKSDSLLKLLPVVIYTARADREAVKRGLVLRIQNFLIKPYHDDSIFAEIAKATANPWRDRHFEEEKSFCKMMGYEPVMLQKMLDALRSALDGAKPALLKWLELQAARQAGEELAVLSPQAEAAGAWGVVDCLKNLDECVTSNNWADFAHGIETLETASRLIFQHLNPSVVPVDFLSELEQNGKDESRQRATWFDALAEKRCPVVQWPQLERELDALSGCPVIDSAAASFQMSATGHPSCLSPLMDLVDKDPGLAAQMLIAANQARNPTGNDSTAVEDPRLAVGLLGELRLASQSRSLVSAHERLMSMPQFNWQQFWMFQIGTAKMARYACKALEFSNLAATAYTAGLLHDLGKLLLLRLHPFGLQAILRHAQQSGGTLREAERLFLDCTTDVMAAHFAEKQGLPRRFVNVIRWVQAPAKATADRELVAVVSLARNLCQHNHVGSSGERPLHDALPLEETEEWGVLRQSVFPSFNLRTFEMQVHAECRELKMELHGLLPSYAVA